MGARLPAKKTRFFSRARFAPLFGKWWMRFGVLPALATGPGGVINVYLSKESLRPALEPWIPTQLLNWVNAHPVQAQFITPAWAWLILFLYAFVVSKKATTETMDVKRLLFLHELLETVVSSKAARFGDYFRNLTVLKKAGPQKNVAKDAFADITQPKQQIILLTQAIYSFFSNCFPEVSIRVSVATTAGDSPEDWLYWYPEEAGPRTAIGDLRNRDSAMSWSIRKKDLFVVEDIRRAARGRKRTYVQAREDSANEDGSLICFPVVHHYSRDVPYVINVAGNVKKCFKLADKDLYTWMMQHFTLRIGLEHSLLLIKKECQK